MMAHTTHAQWSKQDTCLGGSEVKYGVHQQQLERKLLADKQGSGGQRNTGRVAELHKQRVMRHLRVERQ